MNYIKKLEEQNVDKGKALVKIQRDINQMLVFLESSKFTGTEENGARKDWISTGDVKSWLMDLRQITIV